MQSFQDFLKSRRQQPAEADVLLVKRSKSFGTPSSPQDEHISVFHRSLSSKASPNSRARSLSPSLSAARAADGVTTHTTTTFAGVTPTPGSRYLARADTAASSRNRLSEGLCASLQQLVSPQRSTAALHSASSFQQQLGDAGNAAAAAASFTAVASSPPPRGAAAAGELLIQASTSASRVQPLSVQDALHSPLSRSAAATPPGARTPTGGRRYLAAAAGDAGTFAAAGASSVAPLGFGPAERSALVVLQEAAARAAALNRSTTLRSQASQADSMCAAQLTSQQLYEHIDGWQQAAASQQQVMLEQTNFAQQQLQKQPPLEQQQQPIWQRHQQQQVQQDGITNSQGYQQQQQHPPYFLQEQQLASFLQQHSQPPDTPDKKPAQQLSSPTSLAEQQSWVPSPAQRLLQQQQAEGAAQILHDLDRRFASIKDSFRGLLSPQETGQQPGLGPGPETGTTACGGGAEAVGGHPGPSAASRSAQQHADRLESLALTDNSSSGRVSEDDSERAVGHDQGQCSRQQWQQQQQRQRRLHSPRDSSSNGSSECSGYSSDSDDQDGLSRWQQQHQPPRHRRADSPLSSQLAQVSSAHQHHKHSDTHPVADVTLSGGVPDRSSRQQQHHGKPGAAAGSGPGKPAAIAAAAAAAAATAAAAADSSLPIEVDVKCGEEGEPLAAMAHFIVSAPQHSSPLSDKPAGGLDSSSFQQHSGHKKAQHRHHHHHHQQQQQQPTKQQQQLSPEPSLPSTCNLLSMEPSGVSFAAPSVSGTALGSQLDSQVSCTSLELGIPQPRSIKPKPSVTQRQRVGGLKSAATASSAYASKTKATGGTAAEGGGAVGGAAAAVAAAGQGVLDGDGSRWCNNAVILAKHETKELQQQNDALVRVLERERQQHTKTRQQVSDLKMELKEAQAEWEVKLQELRQEITAARAQLRRALARVDQTELVDAFDAALAASASRTEEAQLAAARLATQATEMELQLQQLQLICDASVAGTDGKGAQRGDRRVSATSTSRADNTAVVRAVASAERRSPEKQRSPCRNAFAAGAAPDGCGGRGLRALRQHQAHLEQQLAKQTEELSQLQRENVRLTRFKKQYEVAAQSLQAGSGAKAAAEVFAQEAGLRAAAAAGRADRLEMQVEALEQQVQELMAERDRLQLHLQIAEQQQRLQANLTGGSSSNSSLMPEVLAPAAFGAPAVIVGAASNAAWPPACSPVPALSAVPVAVASAPHVLGGSTQQMRQPWAHAASDPGPAGRAGKSASAAAAAAANTAVRRQPQAHAGSSQAQQGAPSCTPARTPSTTPAAATPGVGGAQHASAAASGLPPAPSPSAAAGAAGGAAAMPVVSAAEQAAMCAFAQLQMALPDPMPVQGQLASLMDVIQAGMQERQALTAQGQVLLDMLVGGS